MLDVGIQVQLDANKALIDAEELTERLQRASVAAASIKMPTTSAAATSALSQSADNAANASLRLAQALAREEQAAGNTQTAIRVLQQGIQQYATQVSAVTIQRVQAQTQLNTLMNQSNGVMQSQGTIMGALIGRALTFAAAYISIREAMNIGGEIIQAREEMDRLDIGMKAITPDANSAAAAEQFLLEKSNQLGLSLRETIPDFVKMSAALTSSGLTMKQAEQAFTDVAIATKAVGLSSAATGRILYDMQEMASLGTVQMRQLRQMMMQMPGALTAFADAAGVTREKFMEMVRAGQVTPEFIATAGLDALADRYKNVLPEAMDTLESHINRLDTSWTKLLADLGKSPAIKGTVDTVNGVLNNLDDDLKRRQGYAANEAKYSDYNTFAQAHGLQVEGMHAYGQDDIGKGPGYPQFFNSGNEQPNTAVMSFFQKQYAAQQNPKGANATAPQEIIPTEAQEAALTKLDELTKKVQADSLDGMKKQEAQIEVNAEKQRDELTKLGQAAGKFVDQDTLGPAMLQTYVEAAKQIADIQNKYALGQQTDAQKQFTSLTDIQKHLDVELISDDQARKVAQINEQFDEIKKNVLLIELANPNFVSQKTYADIEAARQRELADVKPTKTPLPYIGESLSSLESQKDDLQSGLASSKTVEEYQANAQKIQEISQAMHLKLEADDAEYFDAFIYGMRQVGDSFANTAEGMQQIGKTLSESLDKGMTGALTDMAMGTKTPQKAFNEMTLSIITDLEKIVIQTQIVQPIIKALGLGGTGFGNSQGGGLSGVGGLLGGIASLFGSHGMAAGDSAAATGISADAMGMADAFHSGGIVRRAHSGDVIGDEVPIVARRDEGIFTPEQMKAMGNSMGGGRGTNVSIMNVQDPGAISQHIAANPDLIVNAIGARANIVRKILG